MSSHYVLDFVLTEKEGELLAEILQPNVSPKDLVPQRPLDLDICWERLSVCLRTLGYAQKIVAQLKPIIGRFLRIAKDNPEFYLRKGYSNYEKFLTEYVGATMNMSRSVLYECRTLAENLPDMTPEEYYELGSTKAKDLARFTKTSDPSFPRYLQEAKDRTALDFRKYCEEQHLIEAGETVPVVIVIQANEKIERMWKEFIELPEVHVKVGTSNPAVILEHLLMEGYYWTVPVHHDEQSERGAHPGV